MGKRQIANEAPDHVALDTLGKAMYMAANSESIYVANMSEKIEPFVLGDMTSTVYPVGGSMEDWAYGAGFDTEEDAGFDKCFPTTLPELEDSFFESQENVRCAVYLIETSNSKDPTEASYGGREIFRDTDDSGDFQVSR